jgi:hypothetical protein
MFARSYAAYLRFENHDGDDSHFPAQFGEGRRAPQVFVTVLGSY